MIFDFRFPRPSCGEWRGQLSSDQECRRWVGLGGAGRGYPLSDAGLVTTAHWHQGTMAPGPRAAPTLLPRWPRVKRWVDEVEDKSEEVLWECGGVLVKWSQDPGDSRE